jgi:hypothetical protein
LKYNRVTGTSKGNLAGRPDFFHNPNSPPPLHRPQGDRTKLVEEYPDFFAFGDDLAVSAGSELPLLDALAH